MGPLPRCQSGLLPRALLGRPVYPRSEAAPERSSAKSPCPRLPSCQLWRELSPFRPGQLPGTRPPASWGAFGNQGPGKGLGSESQLQPLGSLVPHHAPPRWQARGEAESVCLCVWVCVLVCVFVCLCMPVWLCMSVRVYVSVCIYICVCLCVCVCALRTPGPDSIRRDFCNLAKKGLLCYLPHTNLAAGPHNAQHGTQIW